MAHDEFDLYDIIIRDTSEIANRRLQLESHYTSLITLVLTGHAYLIYVSNSQSYDNWVFVSAATVLSVLGLLVTLLWRNGQRLIGKVLQNRYDFLRKLEETAQLQGLGANIFTDEWAKFYRPGYGSAFGKLTISLQFTFMLVFILIPILFVIATANADGTLQQFLNFLHL